MKKTISIMIFIFYVFSIFSNEVSIEWNKPEITSGNQISILQQNIEEVNILPGHRDENFYFALEDWSIFKLALKNFLLSDSNNHKFISYHSNDNKKKILLPGTKENLDKSSVSSPKIDFDFQLFTGYDYVSNLNDNYSFAYYGANLSGHIQQKLFFYSHWWAGHFAGDIDYAEDSKLNDSWTQKSDDNDQFHIDNVTGKLLYQLTPNFNAAIGRGKYEIGNNIAGSVILNNDCNDYGYLSTNFNFKTLSISMLHSTLLADSTIAGPKDYPDKYLALHKINWNPSKKLEIFAGESVVYGDRGIDLNYLVPITFWRAVEHNQADRDNVLVFAGLNYEPFDFDIFYTNFILDELSKSKFFSDWWGNKYAIQTGYSHKLSDVTCNNRITFELTAIRPWLYTHKYIQNKYSNNGIGLGFPGGSNLLNYAVEMDYSILPNLSMSLHAAYQRKGSVGNDFSINYESRDRDLDEDTHWLEGDITDKSNVRLITDWQFSSHHRIIFGFSVSKIDDLGLQKEASLSYQARY